MRCHTFLQQPGGRLARADAAKEIRNRIALRLRENGGHPAPDGLAGGLYFNSRSQTEYTYILLLNSNNNLERLAATERQQLLPGLNQTAGRHGQSGHDAVERGSQLNRFFQTGRLPGRRLAFGCLEPGSGLFHLPARYGAHVVQFLEALKFSQRFAVLIRPERGCRLARSRLDNQQMLAPFDRLPLGHMQRLDPAGELNVHRRWHGSHNAALPNVLHIFIG